MPETVIRYLEDKEKNETRVLYEACFPEDTKEFVDYYYKYKTSDNEIIVMEEQNRLQVMIHLNPFIFSLCGESVQVNYVVAVATEESVRKQGKMALVMKQALVDMASRHMPFAFLIPANPKVYRSCGFVFVPTESYQQENNLLQEFINRKTEQNIQAAEVSWKIRMASKADIENMVTFANHCLKEKYDVFPSRTTAYYNRMLQELESENGGILLLEEKGDLVGIISYGKETGVQIQEMLWKESAREDFIRELIAYFQWEDLNITEMKYMVRILDLKVLCLLLQSEEPYEIKVHVTDSIVPQNVGCYEIKVDSHGSSIKTISKEEVDCHMDITELTEVLFDKMKINIREWV